MTLHHGDLFDILPTLPEASIDACVTDPPYGIRFMGKAWDTFAPFAPSEGESRRVPNRQINSDNPNLKGRTRAPASSPSSVEYDYSAKGLRAFQEFSERWAREVLRVLKPGAYIVVCGAPRSYHRMACGVEDAGFVVRDLLAWLFGTGFPKSLNLPGGFGTALKPGHEPILIARKPFEGTVEANLARHGTGAFNIDDCRVEGETLGRWPANVALDEDAAAFLDQQQTADVIASRFFYVAKPSRAERDLGCEDLPARSGGEATDREDGSAGLRSPRAGAGRTGGSRNIHPTVKPIELMQWLIRLVTPIDGVVLDPFLGSGTTGAACVCEGRGFVGIEREAEYFAIAERRIRGVAPLFAEVQG